LDSKGLPLAGDGVEGAGSSFHIKITVKKGETSGKGALASF
jgi:hypothetical protein